MQPRLSVVLWIALSLIPVMAQPGLADDKVSCEGCPFTLKVPEHATVTRGDKTLQITVDGLELTATTQIADFETVIKGLSNEPTWKFDLGASRFDFQGDEPTRGQYRDVSYAAMAGTATVGRKRLWVSWLAFDAPDGQVVVLLYRIQGNPSPPTLLELYDTITASMRWRLS